MGDVTLLNFLGSHQLLPVLPNETEVYVVLIGDVYAQAQKAIAGLRDMGLRVAVDSSGRKVGDQVKVASKKGIHYALFVGETELREDRFNLKNLQTGEESTHSLERIASLVKDYRS